MNRVDQSQSLTGVRKMGFLWRQGQTPNFLKSAIQSMADLKMFNNNIQTLSEMFSISEEFVKREIFMRGPRML